MKKNQFSEIFSFWSSKFKDKPCQYFRKCPKWRSKVYLDSKKKRTEVLEFLKNRSILVKNQHTSYGPVCPCEELFQCPKSNGFHDNPQWCPNTLRPFQMLSDLQFPGVDDNLMTNAWG